MPWKYVTLRYGLGLFHFGRKTTSRRRAPISWRLSRYLLSMTGLYDVLWLHYYVPAANEAVRQFQPVRAIAISDADLIEQALQEKRWSSEPDFCAMLPYGGKYSHIGWAGM